MPIKFSVVIPIYNEEGAVKYLSLSLKNIMDKFIGNYEIIFVNDGSEDKSLEALNHPNLKSMNLIIVNLNEHRGQSIAMQAGFNISQGELIVTMDGDLQNDPEDIPRLLDKMREGYDIVCGWRYDRQDPWNRLLVSKISRILRKLIFKENIHDPGCTLRIFKKEIIKNVFLFNGAHRFFTLIVLRLGYKIGEIKVKHHHRRFGKSKYNIRNRLFEYTRDLMRFSLFDIHKLMRRKTNYEIKEIIRNRYFFEKNEI